MKNGASVSNQAVTWILNTTAYAVVDYAIDLLAAKDKRVHDLGNSTTDRKDVAFGTVSIQILRNSGIVPDTFYTSLATTKDDEKGIAKHLSARFAAPLSQFNATWTRTPHVKNAIDKTEIFG